MESSGNSGRGGWKPKSFWKTQLVSQRHPPPNTNQEIGKDEDLENPGEVESLPDGLVWCMVDLNDERMVEELHKLIKEHYVEDQGGGFRFFYSVGLLLWGLLKPGWKPEWHIGIRTSVSGELIAFIGAMPIKCEINKIRKQAVEVTFLCVRKDFRGMGMAPILIKEITRRVYMYGRIFQALYTGGKRLPTPVSVAMYFHRPLNIRLLADLKWFGSSVSDREVEYFAISDPSNYINLDGAFDLELVHSGLRIVEDKDVHDIQRLLLGHLSRYSLHRVFDCIEEVQHMFVDRRDFLYSYVVERAGRVISFISFYELPVFETTSGQNKTIKSAYLFYYAVENREDLAPLIGAMLIVAKHHGFDVFNCLDIMDNDTFITKHRFLVGDGTLYYYLFNWQASLLSPSKLGILTL